MATRFVRKCDFVTRRIAGETLIVPIRGRVGDLDAIYTLNEMGTVIWELIDGRKDVRQIVEAVSNGYEVVAADAENDTVGFLEALQAAGLIAPAAAGEA